MIDIVLKMDYYSMTIGKLDYKLQWDPYKTEDQVEGPICSHDFVIPENNFGTLGIVASLLTAAGLIAASNQNLRSISH